MGVDIDLVLHLIMSWMDAYAKTFLFIVLGLMLPDHPCHVAPRRRSVRDNNRPIEIE